MIVIATVTMRHDIEAHELDLLLSIHAHCIRHGRSPKAYEVGGRTRRKFGHKTKQEQATERAFNRMVTLGLIDNSRSGRCQLTAQAEALLRDHVQSFRAGTTNTEEPCHEP